MRNPASRSKPNQSDAPRPPPREDSPHRLARCLARIVCRKAYPQPTATGTPRKRSGIKTRSRSLMMKPNRPPLPVDIGSRRGATAQSPSEPPGRLQLRGSGSSSKIGLVDRPAGQQQVPGQGLAVPTRPCLRSNRAALAYCKAKTRILQCRPREGDEDVARSRENLVVLGRAD